MTFVLELKRTYKGDAGTIGDLYHEGKIICKTLERPKEYKGTKNLSDDKKTSINESCCVPEGNYEVDYTYSPAFGTNLFLLLGVKGREGIRIHPANTIDQLLGCIAPVTSISKASYKGKTYECFGSSSGLAYTRLLNLIPKDDKGKPVKWILKITS